MLRANQVSQEEKNTAQDCSTTPASVSSLPEPATRMFGLASPGNIMSNILKHTHTHTYPNPIGTSSLENPDWSTAQIEHVWREAPQDWEGLELQYGRSGWRHHRYLVWEKGGWVWFNSCLHTFEGLKCRRDQTCSALTQGSKTELGSKVRSYCKIWDQ